MAAATVERVALMSIHPEYAHQIMRGTKQVEFRKRPLARDVTHVLVYATAPVSQVIGAFTVKGQVSETPQNLWRRFKDVAGIAKPALMDYYRGHAEGTGIQIEDVLVAETPLCLLKDLEIAHPPQSFRYVSTPVASRIFRRLSSIGNCQESSRSKVLTTM